MQDNSLRTPGGKWSRHRHERTRDPLQPDHDQGVSAAPSGVTFGRPNTGSHPNIDASVQLATVATPQRGLRSRGYAPSST